MNEIYAHPLIHILTEQVLTSTANLAALTFTSSNKYALKYGVNYEIALSNEAQVALGHVTGSPAPTANRRAAHLAARPVLGVLMLRCAAVLCDGRASVRGAVKC